MSTTNANVTPGKIFVPDAQGRILLTIDDLNRLGAPTVTLEATDGIATEDIQALAVTEGKLGALAVTLGLGDPAEAGKGILLNPSGGSVEFKRGDGPVPQGTITGIVASDTSDIGIQEG